MENKAIWDVNWGKSLDSDVLYPDTDAVFPHFYSYSYFRHFSILDISHHFLNSEISHYMEL